MKSNTITLGIDITTRPNDQIFTEHMKPLEIGCFSFSYDKDTNTDIELTINYSTNHVSSNYVALA